MTCSRVSDRWHRWRVITPSKQCIEMSWKPGFILPSSPNWFLSQAADVTRDGALLGFAAKSHAVILRNDERRSFVGHLTGHSDRVTCFAFHQYSQLPSSTLLPTLGSNRRRLVVTASADRSVRVWDCSGSEPSNTASSTDLPCLAVLEHAHEGEILALSASPLVPNLVVTGDQKSVLVVWHFELQVVSSSSSSSTESSDSSSSYSSISASSLSLPPQTNVRVIRHLLGGQHHSPITCVGLSPADPWLVAVGFQSGHILLVDVRDGRVRHRLGGHDEEEHALSWRPQPIGSLFHHFYSLFESAQSDVVQLPISKRSSTFQLQS